MKRVVTAHQPNLLPGVSVMTKVVACDAVIWVDEVDYSHYSYTARNRTDDGTMFSVPLLAATRHGPINRVELDPRMGWRRKLGRLLAYHYGGDITYEYQKIIERPFGLLVGLNCALLDRLLYDMESNVEQHWQSMLLGGRKLETIYDDLKTTGLRKQISTQLAKMTAELGGDVYMSGPSGNPEKGGYLWVKPFAELGIEVKYWKHEGPNPCALHLLSKEV